MLEGKNLSLRTVKKSDLEKLYSFFDSIRVRGEFLRSDLVSFHQFESQFLTTGFWLEDQGTVLLTVKDHVVGAIWFERQSFLDCLNLSFYIFRPEHRSRGLMTEALGLFVKYLFATKKIERLQVCVPDYSKPALRVVQKCGFFFEGIARSSFFQRGKYLDLCIYSLLRSECTHIDEIYAD